MRRMIKSFLLTAAICIPAGAGQARPVTLTCSDSGDLYAQAYKVLVNSKSLTVQIIKSDGPLAGRNAFQITKVNKASDGGFVVTASGRVLNAEIQVMVSPNEKWVGYTDAFTNRLYATDYCN